MVKSIPIDIRYDILMKRGEGGNFPLRLVKNERVRIELNKSIQVVLRWKKQKWIERNPKQAALRKKLGLEIPSLKF